ncbi:MAG: ABC transporter ATP-binding protein [Octadecabacter sp.]|nr:ABC transporter ATP-binding protein [Octadecabacter sp.]
MSEVSKVTEPNSTEALLSVRDLHVEFSVGGNKVHAVNGLSMELRKGETLAIVGESGSGKSVSMLSVLGLIPQPPGKITDGQILYEGRDLRNMAIAELRKIRGKEISMIFQDPMTSLNPTMTIGRQITEMLELHLGMTKAQSKARAIELLDTVGIPKPAERFSQYPIEFSGGMRQRVMIAIALSCNPKILIADEPTTALDVTIQMQILQVVNELSSKMDMSVIWITHDLGVVAGLADRVIVMYGGRAVEVAEAEDLFYHPQHPYSVGLLNSVPSIADPVVDRLVAIDGLPPDLSEKREGCAFHPRCPLATDLCRTKTPTLENRSVGGLAACFASSEDVAALAQAGADKRNQAEVG